MRISSLKYGNYIRAYWAPLAKSHEAASSHRADALSGASSSSSSPPFGRWRPGPLHQRFKTADLSSADDHMLLERPLGLGSRSISINDRDIFFGGDTSYVLVLVLVLVRESCVMNHDELFSPSLWPL
jgi:hypothetical protein